MDDFGLSQLKKEGETISYGAGAIRPSKSTSWLELIEIEMHKNDDSLDSVVRTNGDTSTRFSGGFGSVYTAGWTVWTATHVYVPATFDGRPSIVSAPRAPSDFVYLIDDTAL